MTGLRNRWGKGGRALKKRQAGFVSATPRRDIRFARRRLLDKAWASSISLNMSHLSPNATPLRIRPPTNSPLPSTLPAQQGTDTLWQKSENVRHRQWTSFNKRATLASLLQTCCSVSTSGRSRSSTYAIGALSPTLNPIFKMRR